MIVSEEMGEGGAGLVPPQNAELVALGVGENDEALAAGLPDVGPAGAERQQPLDLRVDISVGGSEIRVVTVLPSLRVGGRLQPHAQRPRRSIRQRPQVGVPRGARLDPVAQRLRPEDRHQVESCTSSVHCRKRLTMSQI